MVDQLKCNGLRETVEINNNNYYNYTFKAMLMLLQCTVLQRPKIFVSN